MTSVRMRWWGMTASRYRKKPVVIEARELTADNIRDIHEWITEAGGLAWMAVPANELYIETLEGSMHASIGDYIIKGIKGEFYACKPDIFELTYEPE